MFKKKRNIDIVFCIDGTGSMSPCIGNVILSRRHIGCRSPPLCVVRIFDWRRKRQGVFHKCCKSTARSFNKSPFFNVLYDIHSS